MCGYCRGKQWECGGTARVTLRLVYSSVDVVRGHFSCEILPPNLFLLQFGCLLVNPSTHQNSDRELLLGPEKRKGGGRERGRGGEGGGM